METIPKKGIQGLIQNWRSDLIAAISVALIALPLSLGIALAAGAPAMSGIFSAIIGGVIRDEQGFIALGDFKIVSGDRVVVCCLPQSIKKIESYFD